MLSLITYICRRALHNHTADYYEKEFERTDALGPVYTQIIHHLERGGNTEKVQLVLYKSLSFVD